MAFSDLMAAFRPKPATPIATPVTPSTPASVLANPTIPNPNTPNPADGANKNTAFGKGGEGDQSPLGNFDKLWQIDPNKKALESAVPTFNSDPAKMMELAGTADFMKHIDPELLAKATKGDGTAMMEVIQKSAQAGFAHSNLATTKIVETALTQLNEKYEKDVIPRILAAERVRNTVAEDNPIFTNTAAQPVVEMIRNQMMSQYPTASPAEIKTMVADYITGFATLAVGQTGKTIVDPKVAAAAAPMQRADQDWEKLLT